VRGGKKEDFIVFCGDLGKLIVSIREVKEEKQRARQNIVPFLQAEEDGRYGCNLSLRLLN
jgi:hypothetical protein